MDLCWWFLHYSELFCIIFMQPKIRITWIQILAELLKIRTFTNHKIPPKKSLFYIIFVKISAQYQKQMVAFYELQNNSVPNLPVLKYLQIIVLLYFSFLCIISTVRVPTQNFQFYLAEALLLRNRRIYSNKDQQKYNFRVFKGTVFG